MNILPIKSWKEYKERPLLIAGPCSAESEKQVMQTAIELAKSDKVDIFRAGIWKPRTRPDSFEGVGSKGLPWLKKVKEETGLPVTTEVANVKHVYEALKHGIEILWIGARTSANPFAVQEIADALKDADATVLIKNPINPDPELWIGAIERIYNSGFRKIGAIHRGFSSYDRSRYRNPPQWQIPIELRSRIPQIPLLCDPSHISGDSSLIFNISQKAMDLNFDGLIIETHIDPGSALSDAKQQITPNHLMDILANLILRDSSIKSEKLLDILGELRDKIDILDDQLLEILEKRLRVVDTIGEYKKENNITILQNERWEEIVRRNITNGLSKNISERMINKILKAIHEESIDHQTAIMNDTISDKS